MLEETVVGMGGVLHDTICFAGASCKENVQDGGERGTDDFCSCAAFLQLFKEIV